MERLFMDIGQDIVKILPHRQCKPGLLLPLMDESSWNPYIRATLYFIGLGYSFLGMAVVMEIFMSSIEYIINKRKKMYSLRDDLAEKVSVRVWDTVVANLTLLCVGTSAPELFISIIEVVGHDFEVGFIGPGSIVGSAAVNLLIIAMFNMALDPGRVKIVQKYAVFCWTGFFSVFSFFWIYIILEYSSKGEVEVWEALLTFSFYPLLVTGAYVLNKKVRLKEIPHYWRGDEGEKEIAEATFFKDGVLDEQSLILFLREIKNYPGITTMDAAILAAAKLVEAEPHSMLWYRMGGVRTMSSGKPLQQRLDKHLQEVLKVVVEAKVGRESSVLNIRLPTPDTLNAVVEFASATVAVTENAGIFPIYLNRSGNLNTEVEVRVQSMDGRAKHGEDYDPVNEIITFRKKQTVAEVPIRIINERKYEPTEEFFLRLTPHHASTLSPVKIGPLSIMEIKIIHDESPGVIQFEKKGYVVDEAVGLVTIYLERFLGADGEVRVGWRTVDDTAMSGVDYEGAEGVVQFQHGQVKRFLMIRIFDTMTEEKDVRFHVDLFDPAEGAVLGDNKRTTVIITDDDNVFDYIENVMTLTKIKMQRLSFERENWCKQIKEAMMVNGGVEPATNMEFFLHFLCFFWKVVFSLIPPPGILGGWLQFFTSMFVVAVMATLIGDMASIFGCVAGIEDSLTALVLVGIGTSLPDIFACLIVMRQSKTADEAIGNINGTCSVNVFVGLGLPWTMAAIHHRIKGDYFSVPPEGFSGVMVGFSVCCLITFIFFLVRRHCKACGYAEVGGSKEARLFSIIFLILLYVGYIAFATLYIRGHFSYLS